MISAYSTHPSVTFKASDRWDCIYRIIHIWFPGNVVLQRRQTVPLATAMKKSSLTDCHNWNWDHDILPGFGYNQQEEPKHGGAVSVTEAFQPLAPFIVYTDSCLPPLVDLPTVVTSLLQ